MPEPFSSAMKKKFVFISGALFLLAVVFLFLLPAPFSRTEQFRVALPIDELSPQLTQFRNWQKWYQPLKHLDSTQIHFSMNDSLVQWDDCTLKKMEQSPVFISVHAHENSIETIHSISLFADSFGFATRINWNEKMNAWNWLKSTFSKTRNEFWQPGALRDFSNSTEGFYGFKIEVTGVPDTLVLTKKMITTKQNELMVLSELYRELESLAVSYHLNPDSSARHMGAFNQVARDSVEVMAGISVHEKIPVSGGISWLEMPPKGKMLLGYFEGPHREVKNLYSAMLKYIRLHNLSTIATPYEKYMNSNHPAADSNHLVIQLYYPIL